MNNEFINSASRTIKEVVSTMQERGDQYADTWGKDGVWLLTKAVKERYASSGACKVGDSNTAEWQQEECKAIALAAFIDQKYSRLAGGYKKDTIIDLISYLSALADVVN